MKWIVNAPCWAVGETTMCVCFECNMQHVLCHPLCIIIVSLFHSITFALPRGGITDTDCPDLVFYTEKGNKETGEPLNRPLQKKQTVSCC